MTIKPMKKNPSQVALSALMEESNSLPSPLLPESMIQQWNTLTPEVKAALIAYEMNAPGPSKVSSVSSFTSTTSSSDDSEEKTESGTIVEEDKEAGTKVVMTPLERAPENVFEITKTTNRKSTEVKKTSASTVTTKTIISTTTKGWRNVFTLPISYDVNMVQNGSLLDPANLQMLEATGVHPKDYNRRYAVIDAAVESVYGQRIKDYFTSHGIDLHTTVINGGEPDKRPEAVDKLLDAMCEYKLRRREPFLAIGGGCVLDIAGLAACTYRRGVPFVRVPTTLLAIVDASVGVKNGVDYCCAPMNESFKNRVGSFYAPSACLLDTAFIASQDNRNISNGFGEIMKLALVRSVDLFEILETHGKGLIESKFTKCSSIPDGVSQRVIDLSIQIMLEELGPNLWEYNLERCVDYGHTFSKLLEMVPGADIMHGEAVNIDGFFCCLLGYLRGYVTMDTVNRVFKCMQSLELPTTSSYMKSDLAWQSCKDAIEHRNGAQRIPLITGIGESIVVSDITREEIDRALDLLATFEHQKSGE
ncbi:MAG: hypothetical protein SGBAC_009009 [Bacillariaceae sp.]